MVNRILVKLTLATIVCAATAPFVSAQSAGASGDETPTFVLSNPLVEPVEEARPKAKKGVQLAPIGIDENAVGGAIPEGGFAEVVPAAPKLVALAHRGRSSLSVLPVNSSFGYRRDPITGSSRMHTGVDLKASYGRTVGASLGGKVLYAGYRGGYGNLVIVDHGKGIATFYAHLSQIAVSVGQRVVTGQKIGAVGSTGRSTGPHLHYEVRAWGTPLDPSAQITFKGRSVLANGRLVEGPAIEGGDEAVATKTKEGKPVPPPPPLPLFESGDSLSSF